MVSLEELAKNPAILDEYKKAILLNLFRKYCSKCNRDIDFQNKIKALYRQTKNKTQTTKIIFEKYFNCFLKDNELEMMTAWVIANLNKKDKRANLSLELKQQLFSQQNGKCSICGEDLGNNWSKIHIDHIIPWSLVGDELENNYQDLCFYCNESKNDRIDYVFKSMIGLL